MHLLYLDSSGDTEISVYTCLAIPADQWRQAFAHVKLWRRHLREAYGIPVHYELHAWKFVSGRGRPSERIIPKSERSLIFRQALRVTATLPGAQIFNAVFPRKDDRVFEWLLNRLNRTLRAWDSHGILFCDEGYEARYTKLIRRMGVFNPIPSHYGVWGDTGESYRNIPIDRILEDPVFKKSERSYFIQLVDFAAYALLRRERPMGRQAKYRIHKGFGVLSPILVRQARPRDPDGIIRP